MSGSLTVKDLQTRFSTPRGPLEVVRGVSFEVAQSEVLGVVGESGSGKSVMLRSLLKLLGPPTEIRGEVWWGDENLLEVSRRRLREVTGGEISMIFQEPMTALNPVLRIGEQIYESLREHEGLRGRDARARAVELLELVGIPSPAKRLEAYPHQFSGGMRQRAMIAIALASKPQLLLADEPTTALDVTIQDQILKLLLRLRTQLGMSVVLVTHDLGVVAQTCDRVAVMYAGRFVEVAPVRDIFRAPKHAYTLGLRQSLPGRRGEPAAFDPHPRRAARPAPSPAGLPLCAPLFVRDGGLSGGPAPAGASRRRPLERLHPF